MDKYFELISNYVNSLSSIEVKVLIAITIILVSIMVYRRLGIKMAFAFLFLCLIIYTLYINDAFSLYEKQEKIKNERETVIQEELNNMK